VEESTKVLEGSSSMMTTTIHRKLVRRVGFEPKKPDGMAA